MNNEKFSNIIKEIRKSNDLTQKQLANKLGVTNRAVSKWESNKAIPKSDLLKKIEKEYNVNLSNLINDKGDNHTNTYEYTYEYSEGETFKIRKKLSKFVYIVIVAVMTIFLFIQISKLFGTKTNQYMRQNSYIKYSKENKKIIDKCDFILDNLKNSNFNLTREITELNLPSLYEYNLTEGKFLRQQINELKNISIQNQELLDEYKNNNTIYNLIYLDSDFYDHYMSDFMNKELYDYLLIYDKNISNNKSLNSKMRTTSNYVLHSLNYYNKYNYTMISLYEDEFNDNAVSDALLQLTYSNNMLLDDIIKAGEIHE